MTKKLKVAVLMGGKSSEREVSLASGKEVVKNLDRDKYDVSPVTVPFEGLNWFNELIKISPDVAFIAMHGPFGEDGTIQGILEYAGIPYTGPGVLSSSIGIDKLMFRKVMKAEGIMVPKFISLEKNEDFKSKLEKVTGPYFVKPNDQGSSVGASIAKTKEDLPQSLELAFKYSDIALIDEYIKGIEITCGILGNANLEALPLVEVIPNGTFFDYKSKYSIGESEEITPARISTELTGKIQEIAKKVYKAVNAKGSSRIDFLLKDNNEPYVLEINTIPGLTSASLLPKAAKAAGISFPELLERIINYAIEKN